MSLEEEGLDGYSFEGAVHVVEVISRESSLGEAKTGVSLDDNGSVIFLGHIPDLVAAHIIIDRVLLVVDLCTGLMKARKSGVPWQIDNTFVGHQSPELSFQSVNARWSKLGCFAPRSAVILVLN